MNPLPNLQSAGLVERSVAALQKRILSGAYGESGSLPAEGKLCVQMGVSRSVIREAMRTLESQGLIEVSQGKRPRIRPVDLSPASRSLELLLRRTDHSNGHLVELRRNIEAGMAAMAAERRSPEDLAKLRDAHASMLTAKTLEERVSADMAFHRRLAEASRNPLFVLVLDVLAELMRNSRLKTIGHGGIGPARRGHAEVLAAVERGNERAARAAMLRHLKEAKRDLDREKKKAR